jgi:hypothetical protein
MLLYDVNVVEALRPVTGCGRVVSLRDDGCNCMAPGIPACLPDPGTCRLRIRLSVINLPVQNGPGYYGPAVIPLLCSEGYEQQEDRDREGDHEVVINR